MQDKEEIVNDKWDLFTDMDLAEMWLDSRGISNRRSKIDDEWVVIATFEFDGELLDIILHSAELECKADEWRYENE